jgi:hypothetical protein
VFRAKSGEDPLAAGLLQRRCGVDQAAVEEDEAGLAAHRRAVGKCQVDGAAREGGKVQPRQGAAARRQLLLHDAAAGLFHDGMAAPAQFFQKGRFSAAGAAGEHDETIGHDVAFPVRKKGRPQAGCILPASGVICLQFRRFGE